MLDYYDLFLTNVKPIKILIQDDLHHTHRLWLMNKINLYFGHSYVFAFYDYRTNITEVDLVISNYYIDTGKNAITVNEKYTYRKKLAFVRENDLSIEKRKRGCEISVLS